MGTIPYTPLDFGAQIIEFKLNTGQTLKFILDTGTNAALISDATAKKLGLPVSPGIGGDGKPFYHDNKRAQMITLPKCQTGNINLPPMNFFLAPSSELLNIVSHEIDGIVGIAFFNRCSLLFDFQKHEIAVYQGDLLTEAQLKQAGMEGASVLPLVYPTINYTGKDLVAVRVRFNDTDEEDMMLDSGSLITLLSPKLAKSLKLKPVSAPLQFHQFGRYIPVNESSIQDFAFGSLTLHTVDVYYSSTQAFDYQPHLGMDILSKFRVMMDLPHMKLYLKPVGEVSH